MTWVKICGITDEASLDAAVTGGADAVGFVLAPDSPRTLTPDRATALMRSVPILRFIVTVDLTPAQALAAAQLTGADGIQNHGLHAAEVAAAAVEAGYHSLHPIRVLATGPEVDVDTVPEGSLPLFDTASAIGHGGTGAVFDWGVLDRPERPFVVAGGLGPENVLDAIEALDPYGVDASSRLESSPGVKDPRIITDFLHGVKAR